MTNKLVVIINSLKVPKIKKLLLYEMKFLTPNYSCLQKPWLGGRGLPPPDPHSLSSVLNWICWTLPEQNSWVRHWLFLSGFILLDGVEVKEYEEWCNLNWKCKEVMMLCHLGSCLLGNPMDWVFQLDCWSRGEDCRHGNWVWHGRRQQTAGTEPPRRANWNMWCVPACPVLDN